MQSFYGDPPQVSRGKSQSRSFPVQTRTGPSPSLSTDRVPAGVGAGEAGRQDPSLGWARPGSGLSHCLSPGAQASLVGHLLPTEPPSCPVKVARPEIVTALPLSTAVRSEKGLHETTWSNSFFLAWLRASL